jgi:hypothetical protein
MVSDDMAVGYRLILGRDNVSTIGLLRDLLESAKRRSRMSERAVLSRLFVSCSFEPQRLSGEEAGHPVLGLVLSRARRRRCDVCDKAISSPSVCSPV